MSLILMCSVDVVLAEEIAVAAASDLKFAFADLTAEFEKASGHHMNLTLGSSGSLYAQIQNGAPFDLYFSADIGYPKKLDEAGLTAPGSLYRYAVGRIVIWTRSSSQINVDDGFVVLRAPSVKKIAIANPKHAPYGRAAVAAMEQFKVYEEVEHRLVLSENIAQAAQLAESGACDIGVIALSLALAPTMKAKGTFWEIPESAHAPLEQGAVILRSSTKLEAAKQFLEFLQGKNGREIMTRYGFTLPN